MITIIVLGTAVTVAVVLLATMLTRNAPRRERSFASSGEFGIAPWIDGGAGSSDCGAGTSSDAGAGCSDGGGGSGN